MSGEADLDTQLRNISATLTDDVFVFATIAQATVPAGLHPQMTFREAEGITIIVRRSEAAAHGLNYTYPCRMITLSVHSSLHAVGFLARVARALAEGGISVNPVSAFFRDHLFVPEAKARDAMGILRHLSGKAGR